jgi:hypothetical protein
VENAATGKARRLLQFRRCLLEYSEVVLTGGFFQLLSAVGFLQVDAAKLRHQRAISLGDFLSFTSAKRT